MKIKNQVLKYYFAIDTIFGTKKKVNKINLENIKKTIKGNGKEELTVLLHGTGSTYYGAMYGILKWFTKKGIRIVSIGYNDSDKVKESALNVKKQIDKIMKESNIKKINIIGISLGGLIARYYVEMRNGKKVVDKLITVYTPFKTVNSKFGIFLNKLVGGKPEEYNKATEEIKNKFSVKNHLAIYGKHDGIIGRQYPFDNLQKYIKQIGVEGGHTLVSYNIDAMEIALRYLKNKK